MWRGCMACRHATHCARCWLVDVSTACRQQPSPACVSCAGGVCAVAAASACMHTSSSCCWADGPGPANSGHAGKKRPSQRVGPAHQQLVGALGGQGGHTAGRGAAGRLDIGGGCRVFSGGCGGGCAAPHLLILPAGVRAARGPVGQVPAGVVAAPLRHARAGRACASPSGRRSAGRPVRPAGGRVARSCCRPGPRWMRRRAWRLAHLPASSKKEDAYQSESLSCGGAAASPALPPGLAALWVTAAQAAWCSGA